MVDEPRATQWAEMDSELSSQSAVGGPGSRESGEWLCHQLAVGTFAKTLLSQPFPELASMIA